MMVRWSGAMLFFVASVSCGGSGSTYVTGGAGAGGVMSSGGTMSSGGSGDGGSSDGGSGSPSGGADGGSNGNSGGTSSADGGSAGSSPNGGSAGVGGAPGTPSVLIVVEAGSTMFEPRAERWDRVYDALMNASTGLVAANQSQMHLGFASFSDGGALGTCSQVNYVAPAPANAASINTIYSVVQAGVLSPSGDSLTYIVSAFAAASSAGRKFMILILAGDPEICGVADPDCGQDAAIAAIQRARTEGISTLVLGVGDFVTPPVGFCVPTIRRCGTQHLEDLANAGVGMGVATPPLEYGYDACILDPMNLEATYGAAGSAEYYIGASPEEVRAELDAMFVRILVNAVP